jgi:hypothetical protein
MQFRASTCLYKAPKRARLPQWPADYLADGDKSQSARFQPVEGLWHRFDRAAVDVVAQNDAALMRVLQDAVGDDAGARAAPVLWINGLQNCRQGLRGVQPRALAVGEGALGRAKGDGRTPGDLKNSVGRLVNFTGDGGRAHTIKKWMRPTVIADLVAFFDNAPCDFRMLHHAVANKIECRAHAAYREGAACVWDGACHQTSWPPQETVC